MMSICFPSPESDFFIPLNGCIPQNLSSLDGARGCVGFTEFCRVKVYPCTPR